MRLPEAGAVWGRCFSCRFRNRVFSGEHPLCAPHIAPELLKTVNEFGVPRMYREVRSLAQACARSANIRDILELVFAEPLVDLAERMMQKFKRLPRGRKNRSSEIQRSQVGPVGELVQVTVALRRGSILARPGLRFGWSLSPSCDRHKGYSFLTDQPTGARRVCA